MSDIKPDSNSQVEDVKTGEGSSDANTQPDANKPNPEDASKTQEGDTLSLDKLNTLAGRKDDNAFKSLEDFEKHYDNLKSFVGKKTEVADSKTEVKTQDSEGNDSTSVTQELNDLKDRLEVSDFLREHPDSKNDLSLIQQFAGKENVSLEAAMNDEGFKQMLEDLNVGREKRNEETSIETNSRVGTEKQGLDESLIEAAKAGDSASQEQVVEKLLFKSSD